MFAAIDIGGTKTLVAVFTPEGEVVESQKFPTSQSYEQFKLDLADKADKLSTKTFLGGAVGMRGNVDREAGLSLLDDVLPWGTVTLRADCEKLFNCSFTLENDSKAAGLAEAKLVDGEFRKVLYVTVSTGIGSALIIDGKLDSNTIDSEIGKSVYEYQGRIQKWEDFASGKAIVDKYHKRASEIEDLQIWREISKNLALGLMNAITAYRPDVVILGGGVGAHFKKFKEPLKEVMAEIRPKVISLPELRQAQHADEAVIYGCYELAKQHYAKLSR